MKKCPCCSETLLRHARHTGVYWFCTHCWQEMPDLSLVSAHKYQALQPLQSLSEHLSLTVR